MFPGSGNHFPGMGRELGLRWPQVLRRQPGIVCPSEQRSLAALPVALPPPAYFLFRYFTVAENPGEYMIFAMTSLAVFSTATSIARAPTISARCARPAEH